MTMSVDRKDVCNEIFAFMYLIVLEIIITFMCKDVNTAVFYFTVIDISMLFAWIAEKTDCAFWMFLSFLCAFIPMGLRYYMGDDDVVYENIFYGVAQEGVINRFVRTTMEPGYLLLNKLVALFTDNYLVLQFICVSIFLGFTFAGIYKLRQKLSLPTAVLLVFSYLYFAFMSAGLVRISLAVGIIMYNLHYIWEEEPMKFVRGGVIASLFHYSALSTLILVLLANKQEIRSAVKKTLVFAGIFIPVGMGILVTYIIPILGPRYSEYAETGTLTLSLSSFDMLPCVLLGLYCIRDLRTQEDNRVEEDGKMMIVLITITFLSCIWSVYSTWVKLGRVIFYYGIGMIFLLSVCVKIQTEGSLKKFVIQAGVITYAVVYMSYAQFLNDYGSAQLFPYTGWLR